MMYEMVNYGYYGEVPSPTETYWEIEDGAQGVPYSTLLAKVATAHPKTQEQLDAFFGNLLFVARVEAGESIHIDLGTATDAKKTAIPDLREYTNVDTADPARVGPAFGHVKKQLLTKGAPKSAAALTKVASWYWNNVEKPTQTPKSISKSPRKGAGKAGKSEPPAHYQANLGMGDRFLGTGEPIYKKPVVWTGILLVTVGLIVFWPQGD
jgi:hypothetical protein